MALEFRVLWAGRRQPAAWEALCEDYRKRIGAFHPIDERAIRVAGSGDDRTRLRREGEALAAAAPENAWWVALERTGRALDSEQLAEVVEGWRREWAHPVVFFLGSDLGLATDLVNNCRTQLSFGPLTLPHALARLVLLEQLYRALSIGAGWPYHRG